MVDGRLISQLHSEERPRERFLSYGARALSTEEILAILLRSGCKGTSVLLLAKEIIDTLQNGLGGLGAITPESLLHIKGIGKDKAVTICAAIELGRRLTEVKAKKTHADFSCPEAVAHYVMERMRHEMEEHFQIALLNAKNRLIRIVPISTGGLTSSMAEQRKVFRKAIESNAAAIILLHNHPTGDPTPSVEDVKVTKVFVKAGDLMGIPVLDHIVIGDGEYISLCESGYI